VRSYMAESTWYKEFFARHFGWLFAVFALLEVCLSAMQVLASLGTEGTYLESTIYGFGIMSFDFGGSDCRGGSHYLACPFWLSRGHCIWKQSASHGRAEPTSLSLLSNKCPLTRIS